MNSCPGAAVLRKTEGRDPSERSTAAVIDRTTMRCTTQTPDPARANPARPLIFGVINVTPDSFSDGGRYLHVDDAVARGIWLAEHGADLVDVGGESTRPGAVRISPEVEIARVLPVVAALAQAGVRVSIDTMHSATAVRAVEVGAVVVNDVSGGTADPDMYAAVAAHDVDYVLMHSRGPSGAAGRYGDVVEDVVEEIRRLSGRATAAGIDPRRVIVDPGLGFSKSGAENWAVLGHLPRFAGLGFRLLIGASRKRFLAPFERPSRVESADLTDAHARDLATTVLTGLLTREQVWGIRVHDVEAARIAIDVAAALDAGRQESPTAGPELDDARRELPHPGS
jgi:dihydropteroate synthase